MHFNGEFVFEMKLSFLLVISLLNFFSYTIILIIALFLQGINTDIAKVIIGNKRDRKRCVLTETANNVLFIVFFALENNYIMKT